jgi:hypothetical protein
MIVARVGLLIIVATFSSFSAKGQSKVNPHDLEPQVKLFDNYSKDFSSMEQPAHGDEFEALNFYQGIAAMAEDRMAAANAELKMYDLLGCPADRIIVRSILVDRLKELAWLFDTETSRAAGALKFLTAPAEAQEAVRLKDDLRAGKERLQSLIESLQ